MLIGFKLFITVDENINYFSMLNDCIYEPNYLLEADDNELRREFEKGRAKAPWRSRIRDFFSKNPKIDKSDLVGSDIHGTDLSGVNNEIMDKTLGGSKGYESYIVHLTPAAQSGFITCPCASPGCKSTCLQTSGNIGALADKTGSRLKKTWFIAKEMPYVVANMVKYLTKLRDEVIERGNKLVLRLNGTSDLHWEDMKDEEGNTLMDYFPDIMFYDYTKIGQRLGKTPENYHLTFSRSEENDEQAVQMLAKGHNVAVVFGPGKVFNREKLEYPDGRPLLPVVWNGYKVINGDKHDLRFLEQQPKDAKGLVIGLIAKGSATFESYSSTEKQFTGKSGFVVQPNDPSITAYKENEEFVRVANAIVARRNGSKQNTSGQYGRAKAKYVDEQRIIAGLLTGNLSVEEKRKLAKEPHYKRLIGKFDEIEAYCKKYPSMCQRDYLAAAGKKAATPYTDVGGDQTFSPLPFDVGRLRQMGVISGNRTSAPPVDDEAEREGEFTRWLASRNRPAPIPLPVVKNPEESL